MNCPTCGQQMVLSGNFYVCGNHEAPVFVPENMQTASESEQEVHDIVNVLPTPIAIVYEEYLQENQPFVKLHRLTDVAEIVTRFFAVVSLSTIYELFGSFPESLKRVLVQNISRPTFGSWINITQMSLDYLKKEKLSGFIEQLPSFWNDMWKPLMGANQGNPESNVLALRNNIAHAGRLPNHVAQTLCDAICANFECVMEQLDFLDDYKMIATTEKGELPYLLKGLPNVHDWTLAQIDEVTDTLDYRPKHIYLIKDNKKLSLFPLHAYDTVMVWSEELQEFKVVDLPSSLLYLRYNVQHNVLEYTALAQDKSYSQKGDTFLENFLSVFDIPGWQEEIRQRRQLDRAWPEWDYTFRDVIDELTFSLVGREKELEDVKKWLEVRHKKSHILWVSGEPGIGKSAFSADVVKRLSHRKHTLLIPFFFREGDIRCHIDAFYRIAILKLIEKFHLDVVINQNESLFSQFQDIVQTVNELDGDVEVLFVLDGLDEIRTHVQSLEEIVKVSQAGRFLWILSSRSDDTLLSLVQSADLLWDDGCLPPLSSEAVRSLIQAECQMDKYLFFERDNVTTGGRVNNVFLDTLVERSKGLPLYIMYVIQDIQSGQLTFYDERRLPKGLEAYYDALLDRMKVGNYAEILNHLFGILSWAKEPLTDWQIVQILEKHYDGMLVDWQEDLQHVLYISGVVLKRDETRTGARGWTFYHHSFREHVKQNKRMSLTVQRGLQLLLAWCERWEETQDVYAVKFYHEHMLEAGREDIYDLAVHDGYLEAQHHLFPDEPLLPVRTIKSALDFAIDREDGVMIAKFFLNQGHRFVEIMNRTPLDEVDVSSERALHLIEHREDGVVWLLLLMWKAKYEDDSITYEFFYEKLKDLKKWNIPYAETVDFVYYLMGKADVDGGFVREVMDEVPVREAFIYELFYRDESSSLTEDMFGAPNVPNVDIGFPSPPSSLTEDMFEAPNVPNVDIGFPSPPSSSSEDMFGALTREEKVRILSAVGSRNAYDKALQYAMMESDEAVKYRLKYRIAMSAVEGTEQRFGVDLLKSIYRYRTFFDEEMNKFHVPFLYCVNGEVARAKDVLISFDEDEMGEFFALTMLILIKVGEQQKAQELAKLFREETADLLLLDIVDRILAERYVSAVSVMSRCFLLYARVYFSYVVNLADVYQRNGQIEQADELLRIAKMSARENYEYDLQYAEQLAYMTHVYIRQGNKRVAEETINEMLYYGVVGPKFLIGIVETWINAGEVVHGIQTVSRYFDYIGNMTVYESHQESLLAQSMVEKIKDNREFKDFQRVAETMMTMETPLVSTKFSYLVKLARVEFDLNKSVSENETYAYLKHVDFEHYHVERLLALLDMAHHLGDDEGLNEWIFQLIKAFSLLEPVQGFQKVNIINAFIRVGLVEQSFNLLSRLGGDFQSYDEVAKKSLRMNDPGYYRRSEHYDLKDLAVRHIECVDVDAIVAGVKDMNMPIFQDVYFSEVFYAYFKLDKRDAAEAIFEVIKLKHVKTELLEFMDVVLVGIHGEGRNFVDGLFEDDVLSNYERIRRYLDYYVSVGRREAALSIFRQVLDEVLQKMRAQQAESKYLTFSVVDELFEEMKDDVGLYHFYECVADIFYFYQGRLGEQVNVLKRLATAESRGLFLGFLKEAELPPTQIYSLAEVLLSVFPHEQATMAREIYHNVNTFAEEHASLIKRTPLY